MGKLLADIELQEQLERDGYVRFDLLDETDVNELKSLYQTKTSESGLKGFHATMFHADKDYRKSMDQGIREKLNDRLQAIISKDFSLLYANFMVKEPGEGSVMKLHQDWAYVDEYEFDSYAIWIPLLDLNETNGVFQIMEGSHKIQNYVRGPGIEDSFIENGVMFDLSHVKPLYLKAGEAVIWHHRLAHSSPPNKSDLPRIAITSIIVPEKQDVYHYYKGEKDKYISQYLVDKDFYMSYTVSRKPDAELKRQFKYSFDTSDNLGVEKEKKEGFISKILSNFNN